MTEQLNAFGKVVQRSASCGKSHVVQKWALLEAQWWFHARVGLVLAIFTAAVLNISEAAAHSGDAPLPWPPAITVEDAPPPIFTGRWDFTPVIAPDSIPAMVRVTPNGDVWIAGDGAILRRTTMDDALLMDRWADGRSEPVPAIISNDMIVLGEDQVLVSTIWQELYIAAPEGLTLVSPRDIRGAFSFADIPDGRLAIALDDWRIDDDFHHRVSSALGRSVLVVPGMERLVVVTEELYGINNGRVSRIDLETGQATASLQYAETSDDIASARPASGGRILIAATPHYDNGGCYIINTRPEFSAKRLFEGRCNDLIQSAPGEFWASTEAGIFWMDGAQWRTFFTDAPSGIGRAGMFASTPTGSLWVATSDGLWRHYMHTRERPTIADGEIRALHRDASGRILMGDASGAVTIFENAGWRSLLPNATSEQDYSRLPLFAGMADGTVAILHSSGLYVLDDFGLERIANAPEAEGSVAPASMAACPDRNFFVGFAWSPTVARLTDTGWRTVFSHQTAKSGGTAIGDLSCDVRGNLWSLGTETIAVRKPDGTWLETESFALRGNAKGNLFGALLAKKGSPAATAWGAWGYPVAVRLGGQELTATKLAVKQDAPYLFRDALAIDDDMAVILTGRGVYLWENGQLERLPLVEERLQRRATALHASVDARTAFGFRLDIGAGEALFAVAPARHAPNLRPQQPLTRTVSEPFVRLAFELDGRAYPPEEGRLDISVSPPLANGATFVAGPKGRLTLTDLAPNERYTVRAQFTDIAGQVSEALDGVITYVRPWREDPRVWAAAALLVVLALFVAARTPLAVDFVLRRLGRRHWQIVLGEVDRTISFSTGSSGRLEAELTAAGATLRLGAVSEDPSFPLEDFQQQLRSMVRLALNTNRRPGLQAFSRALESLSHHLNESAPKEVQFELQAFEGNSLLLNVTRDLSAIPWECLQGPGEQPIFVGADIARVITTSQLAVHPGLSGRLRAAIFVADAQGGPEQGIWGTERSELARAMRQSGVLEILTPTGAADAERLADWIDGVDLLHLIGHASVSETAGTSSQFWLSPTVAVDQDGLRGVLGDIKRPPALVFINACGSLEQRDDSGAAALTGLATPFLEVGSTVIGTQWPVQTEFATELSVDFYRRVLPPPNGMLWQWLRRRPLEGQTFAAALCEAKRSLYSRRPYTDPTWSAYTIFGNPTARLSLS